MGFIPSEQPRPEDACELPRAAFDARHAEEELKLKDRGLTVLLACPDNPEDTRLTQLDGLNASLCDDSFVTTPNADYVPFPLFDSRTAQSSPNWTASLFSRRLLVRELYGIQTRWKTGNLGYAGGRVEKDAVDAIGLNKPSEERLRFRIRTTRKII
ncbi:hypothetical protein FISHEDRAFT_77712 [Fistulina hepatica ATCC 64428]|nr:hypothetical protein FISHEDRAFT_77712 [Fistulina hepatica ATCC 64428]